MAFYVSEQPFIIM